MYKPFLSPVARAPVRSQHRKHNESVDKPFRSDDPPDRSRRRPHDVARLAEARGTSGRAWRYRCGKFQPWRPVSGSRRTATHQDRVLRSRRVDVVRGLHQPEMRMGLRKGDRSPTSTTAERRRSSARRQLTVRDARAGLRRDSGLRLPLSYPGQTA